MTSRFEASAKNSNTSSSGRGSHTHDSYTNVRTPAVRAARRPEFRDAKVRDA